jgi:tetratricopeptide (TPR) repeat protein
MAGSSEQQIQSLEKHLASQPKSPLFAQLADYYLETGRTQEALALCDQGLANYPFFSTGHLIKGKVLLALNMKSEARREFEFVHEALPQNESIARTLSQIPAGEEETLTAPAPSENTGEPAPPAGAEQVPEQAAEQPAPPQETATDQWMNQFTDQGSQQETSTSIETPPAQEATADAFGLAPETAELAPAAPETPIGAPAVEEGESFDQFAERKRGELFGLEDSLSLEEYLSEAAQEPPSDVATETAAPAEPEPPVAESIEDPFAALTETTESPAPPVSEEQVTEDPFATIEQPSEPVQDAPQESVEDPFAQLSQPAAEEEQSPAGDNQIEEIAEKLKDAKKITPIINLSEREATPPSEAETPSGSGFVTPTLAEIYAKQGWYDDAIKAYRALANSKPLEKEKFEKRIQELEELKKQQDSIG